MSNKKVYSVGQVNAYIKGIFDEDYLLRNVSVSGEVSNCKYHSSGHIYFTLKDAEGSMSAVMFAGSRQVGLRFPMKNGDKVIVTGSVTVYVRDGKYQIYAKEIILAGVGDLYQRFEQLKKELEEMGMFSAQYKKPIPPFAKRVGIITAPTGAAVRDIIQISKRRNPYVQLILYPAIVQGDGAVPSIVSGINALDDMGLDVIIVGRGGGSIEDLWAFNEEAVARAIFNAKTPIISAVGHETDTSIADYVADLRAPTPSAAAELAVFDYRAVQGQLLSYQSALDRGMELSTQRCRQRIADCKKRLDYLSPVTRLNERRQYAMNLENRLSSAMDGRLNASRSRLALLAGQLDGLSPAKKLSQGYAFPVDAAGKKVTSVLSVKAGDAMLLHLSDGSLGVTVDSVEMIC